MSLVSLLDGLINDIGGGLTESAIRGRLMAMREQAEALDIALKQYEAALEDCNSALHGVSADFERFKSDAEQKKLPSEQATLDEMQIKFLRLLFDRDLSIEAIAQQLGILESMAKYHRDALMALRMIERVQAGRKNSWMGIYRQELFGISKKGRDYIVKLGPNE